jgi:hypothetical protein
LPVLSGDSDGDVAICHGSTQTEGTGRTKLYAYRCIMQHIYTATFLALYTFTHRLDGTR